MKGCIKIVKEKNTQTNAYDRNHQPKVFFRKIISSHGILLLFPDRL